jgi:hypothetical protein
VPRLCRVIAEGAGRLPSFALRATAGFGLTRLPIDLNLLTCSGLWPFAPRPFKTAACSYSNRFRRIETWNLVPGVDSRPARSRNLTESPLRRSGLERVRRQRVRSHPVLVERHPEQHEGNNLFFGVFVPNSVRNSRRNQGNRSL